MSTTKCRGMEHYQIDIPSLSGLKQTIGEENVEFSIISGADHEDDLFYTSENLQKVFSFIEAALG